MKASIIIPTYNRQSLTNRAIESVIQSQGSVNVQIIVIDDYSITPFISSLLRTNDILFRNDTNNGPGFCRQLGMEKAQGEIIYFLDSDDFFVRKNFDSDYEKIIMNPNCLYYCDFMYGCNKITKIPDEIKKDDYFDYIFNLYPGIANTCSLCFHSNIKPQFDLSLCQNEDWDFVYSFFKKGLPVKKIEGVVFIDKSDRSSLSRKKDYKKSLPFLEKLKNEDTKIYIYARYWFFSKYSECMTFFEFIKQSFYYLKIKKTNLKFIAKRIIQRFL